MSSPSPVLLRYLSAPASAVAAGTLGPALILAGAYIGGLFLLLAIAGIGLIACVLYARSPGTPIPVDTGATERMLATVSHEMRTPLNGVIGMSTLLADTRLTAEQATYVDALRRSGEGLLALVDDVLEVSRIEAGRVDLRPEAFDPLALAEEVVELLSPRAHDRGLEIVAMPGADLPAEVHMDRRRLRQVLLNLAGNAVKFTVQGGVVVRVSGQANSLVFEVIDTGIGIPPAALGRLFHDFERIEEGRPSEASGAGLGLAISRRLAVAMGGDITVDSTVGRGSTFSVALPVSSVTASSQPQTLQGRRVYLDMPDGVERTAIVSALSGAGAFLVDTLDADVVLADRRLGRAALTRLAIEARQVPQHGRLVVLLTPQARTELEALRREGFAGYLVRPVRHASLIEQAMGAGVPVADPRLAEPAPVSSAVARSLRVLVAEDNPINALLARALLEKLGHTVHHAADGEVAVGAFTTQRFDLVLMDMQMPGQDGLMTARAMRAHEATAGAPRTPILALTANAFAEDRARSLDAGMDDHLTKPLDRDRLLAAIDHHCLAGSRAVDAA